VLEPGALRLPTDPESVIQDLTNSYGGVGKKTAETLVDALGDRLFVVLQSDPKRVADLLPPARAEKLLEGWKADLDRRRERHLQGKGTSERPTVEVAPVAETPSDPVPVATLAPDPVPLSEAPQNAEEAPLSRLLNRLRRGRGGR
jgi:hypothetical protein